MKKFLKLLLACMSLFFCEALTMTPDQMERIRSDFYRALQGEQPDFRRAQEAINKLRDSYYYRSLADQLQTEYDQLSIAMGISAPPSAPSRPVTPAKPAPSKAADENRIIQEFEAYLTSNNLAEAVKTINKMEKINANLAAQLDRKYNEFKGVIEDSLKIEFERALQSNVENAQKIITKMAKINPGLANTLTTRLNNFKATQGAAKAEEDKNFIKTMEKNFVDAILAGEWSKAQRIITELKTKSPTYNTTLFEKRLKDKQAEELENIIKKAIQDQNWNKARELLAEFKAKYPERRADATKLTNALKDAAENSILQKYDKAINISNWDAAKQAIDELRKININSSLINSLEVELKGKQAARAPSGIPSLGLSKDEIDIQNSFDAALARDDIEKARELFNKAKGKTSVRPEVSLSLEKKAKEDIKQKVLKQIDEYNKVKKPEFQKGALFIPGAEELTNKLKAFAKKAEERETSLSMMIKQIQIGTDTIEQKKLHTQILNNEAVDAALADLTEIENMLKSKGASASAEAIRKSQNQIKSNPALASSIEKSSLDVLLGQLVAQPGPLQAEKNKLKKRATDLLNELDLFVGSPAQEPALSAIRSLTIEINKSIDKGNINELDALFKSLLIEVGKVK
jgi:hypothetical protein